MMGIFILLVIIGSFLPDAPAPDTVPQEQGNTDAAASTSASGTTGQAPAGDTYAVVRVVDGDTISASIDGKTETIRFIGIDTPETVDPRKAVQCFGKEASDTTKKLLTDQRVMLEKDPSQGERDKYGRLLAYVYRADGLFVNQYLVEQGYAHEYTYNAPYKYQAQFKAAEAQARTLGRGLWAPGACSAFTPKPPPAAPPASAAGPGGYSCSSNLYDCGDFSTHAQAQSVYESCGGVGNDVHWLDSDKDGIACESLP
jgi:micrococcal nuclease